MSTHLQDIDTKPKISVIIPVYNDAEGLQVTLKSLNQQALDQRHYEIIVANDGGSEEICNVCHSLDIKYVNIVPNQGSYHARNEAMEHARADAFAFVDADVKVMPDWLTNGLMALREADYVAGPLQIIREEHMNLAELYEYYTAFDIKHYLETDHFGVTANLFVRRSVFEILGKFDDRLRSSGDLEFGNRVYQSKRFIQSYTDSILVYHPPRGYDSYVKKIKRGCEGQVKLYNLFPDRFPERKPSFFKAIGKMILPPNLFKLRFSSQKQEPRMRLYCFKWFIDILKGYYTIRAILGNYS